MSIIGIIADTHGLVRDEALHALRGSDLIVHAGDIGRISVIESLAHLAPLHAIRGNVDRTPDLATFPDRLVITVDDQRCLIAHNGRDLDPSTDLKGINVVITGHSHRPLIETREGRLHINPGSAGPRRFRLPVAIARLRTQPGIEPRAEIVELDV